MDVDLQPDLVQRAPAIDVLDGSRLAISWLSETADGTQVMWAEVTGRSVSAVLFVEGDGGVPSVSASWLAYHVGDGVRLVDPLRSVSFLVNDATLIEHTPVVSSVSDGGALGWYALDGAVGDVRVGAFDVAPVVSHTTVLESTTTASSSFDLVAMGDGRWLAAWQDGASGGGSVRAQIVDLGDDGP